jgi:hypothetical protein
MNKFTYLHILQADYGYGHGWEDESQSEDRREVRQHLREYRKNAPEYNYRIVQRRERKVTR